MVSLPLGENVKAAPLEAEAAAPGHLTLHTAPPAHAQLLTASWRGVVDE